MVAQAAANEADRISFRPMFAATGGRKLCKAAPGRIHDSLEP